MTRAWAAAAAMASVLVWAGAAQAATIKVTTTGDPGPAGTTSLRQAISAAHDGDQVSVPPGDYVLKHGAIVVPDAIEITGAAASTTIVSGNHAGGVFQVTSDGSVAFDDLTITAGKVTPSSSLPGGAGVYYAGGSELSFNDDVLSDNEVAGSASGSGGAIYAHANLLSVTNSTLTGNAVDLDAGPSLAGGGAIYSGGNAAEISGTTLTSNKLTITASGGGDYDGGGAIINDGNSVTLNGSRVTDNTVSITGLAGIDGGGAVFDNGDGVTVTSSSLTGNSVSGSSDGGVSGGGGIFESDWDAGPITITGSDISSNTVTMGGGSEDGGGDIYSRGGTMSVTSSTVGQNSVMVTETGSGGGGGIYSNGRQATLVNVTLSDNHAVASGQANGGGLEEEGPGATITSSTVGGNDADGTGGGIFGTNAPVSIKSTIFAGNTAGGGFPSCAGATFTSAGYNLESTAPTECGFTASTDIVGKPADLAPLAPNGGLAPTVALLAGSPAIDHIPKADCTTQNTSLPITTDERGVARGSDGFCDIGAFESAPAHLAVTETASPAAIHIGARANLKLAVSNSGPAPAIASALKVTVPTGLRVVSVTASAGKCSTAHSVVTCMIGLLLSNGNVQLTTSVRGTGAGIHFVTATASASGSDPAPPATARTPVAVIAPKLVGLLVSPDSFAQSTVVRFKLNYAAVVRFTVKRGRTTVGSFTRAGHAAANRFTWRGRVAGHELAPGTYQLSATPTVGGQPGTGTATGFRIAVAKSARAPVSP
jgi:uncharacterized repeat protein (TIGR01451 family)